jgi:hypothetical protein
MSVEALISTQVIDTTSVGRSIMTAADAAAVRTAADAQVTLVSGTNIKTVNSTSLLGSGDITVGLSGTGSVDNAVLRADGTGGATLQSSAIVIDDLFTASPNNTVNYVGMKPTGGTTNVGVAIVPKGTGAFTLAVPDGTTTSGNARGANAVDLQTIRGAAAQIASGAGAVIVGGRNCTASGTYAVAGGDECAATGNWATAFGRLCVASGTQSTAMGNNSTAGGTEGSVALGRAPNASGTSAVALGRETVASGYAGTALGMRSRADRHGMFAHSGGYFAASGDAQFALFELLARTANNTPTTLLLTDNSSRLTIPSGKVMSALCRVCGIKSDGSAVANYVRRVVIKNVAGTTALVGTVETIGTDIEDNAATDVAITADNTNDALDISVTGIAAETWRWVAVVEGLEIAYGT